MLLVCYKKTSCVNMQVKFGFGSFVAEALKWDGRAKRVKGYEPTESGTAEPLGYNTGRIVKLFPTGMFSI